MLITEQLSPELVLVDETLRAAAIAALPEYPWAIYTNGVGATRRSPAGAPPAPARPTRSLIAGAILYTAWHALLGALLASGAVLAIAVMLLALGLATG